MAERPNGPGVLPSHQAIRTADITDRPVPSPQRESMVRSKSCPDAECPVLGGFTRPPERFRYGPMEATKETAVKQLLTTRPFCIDGTSLPQLYLLGVPKAATTTIASGLRQAFGLYFAQGRKEPHFFDNNMDLNKQFSPEKVTKENWLHSIAPRSFHEAACTPNTTRRVLADATPANFFVPHLHTLLRDWYGDKNAQKLVFVVSLRDPLSRVLSWMHSGCKPGLCSTKFPDGQDYTLVNYVERCLDYIVDKKGDGCVTRGLVQGDIPITRSLYSQNLKEWMKVFDPAQFVIFPYKIFDRSPGAVISVVANKLNLPLKSRALQAMKNLQVEHLNIGTYPQELVVNYSQFRGDTQNKLGQIFGPDQEGLFDLLAEAHKSGLALPGFKGATTKEEIKKWFVQHW